MSAAAAARAVGEQLAALLGVVRLAESEGYRRSSISATMNLGGPSAAGFRSLADRFF